MADATFTFPEPLDPWQHAREMTPPSHGSDEWIGFVAAVLTPLALASQEVAETTRQIADPEQATGARLAAIGTWAGLTQGGLAEHEFRRIVVGSLTARYCAEQWTWSRARALWIALTGAADGDVTVETLGPGCVSFTARIGWTPTDGYVARVGQILASAVRDGLDFEAFVVVDGWLVLDGSPGLDSGLLSWYTAGTGGSA